jgi:hypothetical protein
MPFNSLIEIPETKTYCQKSIQDVRLHYFESKIIPKGMNPALLHRHVTTISHLILAVTERKKINTIPNLRRTITKKKAGINGLPEFIFIAPQIKFNISYKSSCYGTSEIQLNMYVKPHE